MGMEMERGVDKSNLLEECTLPYVAVIERCLYPCYGTRPQKKIIGPVMEQGHKRKL